MDLPVITRFEGDIQTFMEHLKIEKPGGRAGLRNVACALHVASSIVCALRALLKMFHCVLYSGASAPNFLVSRAWSCVVRRIPSGKLSSNRTRVASLFGREERL